MRQIVQAAAGTLAAVMVCTGIADPTVFGAKPAPTPDTPIEVTFRNAPSDRLLSDSVSPSYTDGYAGVQAKLVGSTGRVDLFTCVPTRSKGSTTCASQGRAQTFDFTDPSVQFFPPPSATVTQGAQMQIWVFDDGGSTQLTNGFRGVMNYVGEQRRAGSKTNFDVNGITHTLRFTPNMYPNSDYLLVTYLGGSLSCSVSDPSQCARWTVEAGPTHGDIAEFVTGDNSKDYGQFHMPFRITVSVLPK